MATQTWGRDLLEQMMREQMPETYERVQAMPEWLQDELYDRLDRSLGTAFDRAILYGTVRQQQAPDGLAPARTSGLGDTGGS